MGVQDYRQIDERLTQPDVGDVGRPELIHADDPREGAEMRIDGQEIARIGGQHEAPLAHRQQVVLAHQAQHFLVLHHQTLGAKGVAPAMEHTALDIELARISHHVAKRSA